MANYTWLGNLCGVQGGKTISKGSFDGLVGSLIDGNNLYSGKIIRDSAVAAPVTCDFLGNTYMTSSELKDATYDRYNYSREHDFNVLCIPGIDVYTITDLDQYYYVFYNGECTKAGSVFSQLIESVPDIAQNYPFSYTLGCDEEDLDYIDTEVEIVAAGTQVIAGVSQGWVLDLLSTWTDITVTSFANEAPGALNNSLPMARECKDGFFVTYEVMYNNAARLNLYEYNFTNDTIDLRHQLTMSGSRHNAADNDGEVSNCYVDFDETNSRIWLGDQMYTGSKPNQGRIEYYDIDFTLKTITYGGEIAHPSPGRYSYFGCSVSFDGGPNGSGQIVVGALGDETIYFFNGTTFAYIAANDIVGGRDSWYGAIVAAYNGILVYLDVESYRDLYCVMLQRTWSGTAWGTAYPDASNWYSNGVSTIKCCGTSKFSSPTGQSKRPFICCRISGTFSYWGPDILDTRYMPASITYGAIAMIDGPGGYCYGVAYESMNVKRFNPAYGLPWYDLGSVEDDIDTIGSQLGWAYQFGVGVVNPADSTDARLVKICYGPGASYHYFADILHIGYGDVFQVPVGNYYLKHMIDVSLWSIINSGSAVGIQLDDDLVRWQVSTDGGLTWWSVPTGGGSLVEMASFADGYLNAGLIATFNTDIQKVSVLGAQYLTKAFLLVSGSGNQQTSPTITSMTMNYGLIQGDPEFVLNHSTTDYHGKIEHECYQANTWSYLIVTTEAPETVDHCTLIASTRSSPYIGLYGI
jgi:hypothetical protein